MLPKIKYLPKTEACAVVTSPAILKFHKDIGSRIAFPEFPEYYMELISEKLADSVPERVVQYSALGQCIPAKYKFKPHYRIDVLYSGGKGSGTEAVKKVVRESLADKETNGRVLVHADCVDGQSYPGGFYYKLGFRFNTERYNKEFERWINRGGNRENAPTVSGYMHLPKENIEHCLNY